jgi:TfoX/Sxy family transcriptional regulator of competence genes
MAYDNGVAQRVREQMEKFEGMRERKMFGGLAFMLHGNMCCGVIDDKLMARVGAATYDDALKRPGASVMDFTGKSLKGFIYVDAEYIDDDEDLEAWIQTCSQFALSLPPK